MHARIDKNGSTNARGMTSNSNTWFDLEANTTTLVYMNGTTDYIEPYVRAGTNDSWTTNILIWNNSIFWWRFVGE
jgi:hypothetical protein